MKKRNYLIIIFIVCILIFFGIITFYKFGRNDKVIKKHYFTTAEVKNFKKDDETDVNDVEMYGNYIIQTPLHKIKYNFYDKNTSETINGYIYIDENKELYITDDTKNIKHKVSDMKFKTMYFKYYSYSNSICVNLISEDNKVYLLILDSNDITKVIFYDYKYAEKFTNFVGVEYLRDKYYLSNSVFALTEEGKIYDINAGLRYDERTKAVYNAIYIYHDNTMTDIYGRVIDDGNGNRYKIKYIFDVSETNGFLENKSTYVIITEDNKFLCFSDDIAFVYEFSQKVKDIKYDQYTAHRDGNLEITFEDDYKAEFIAMCTKYYCINELTD